MGYSTTRTDQHGPQEQLTAKFRPGDVEIDKKKHFSVTILEVTSYTPVCLEDTLEALLHQPEPQQEPSQWAVDREMYTLPSKSPVAWAEGVTAELCDGH